MTTTSWTGIDGDGNKITFAAEQPNSGGPLTPHFVLEIAGAPIAGPVPVQDAAAEAALVTISTAQGAGGTGITEPTGGSGLLGWLSGIYAALKATLTVADANSAAFQGSVAITPGTPVTAARSLGFVCTAAGNITLTLANASTITLGIVASPTLQTLPFAVTNVALGGSTAGSFFNLS